MNYFSKPLELLTITPIIIILLIIPQINIDEYALLPGISKSICFFYICCIMLGAYFFYICRNNRLSFSLSNIDFALSILVLYVILNRYFIQSNYGFSVQYLELLGLCLFYFIIRHISFEYYSWLFICVILSAITQVFYGILQSFGYYPSNHSLFRMTGSFLNPGPYAGFLVSAWSVSLGMCIFNELIVSKLISSENGVSVFKKKLIKFTFQYIPLLGMGSIIVLIPALQSRASWIGMGVGSIVIMQSKFNFLIKSLKRLSSIIKKIALLFSLFILIVGVYSLYFFKQGSADGRAFIWKIITKMISDRPLFGVGYDRFKTYYMNYQASYFHKNNENLESLNTMIPDNTSYAFNDWLQFIVENGLLGFILLSFVLLTLFLTKVPEEHHVEIFIAKAQLLTIAVFACFSYPAQILPIKIIIVFLVAVIAKKSSDLYRINFLRNNIKRKIYKFMTLMICGICTYTTVYYFEPLRQSFICWNEALINHRSGNYKDAIVDFKLAYFTFKEDGEFLMNYGKSLSMAKENYQAMLVFEQAKLYHNNSITATSLGESYKKNRLYKKAELSYQNAVNMVPNHFYPLYLLAKLYDDSGQEEKAVAMARKILSQKIKIPSAAIDEIQLEAKKILSKYKSSGD